MEFDDKYLEETLSVAIGDKENYHIPKGITRYDFGNSHGWWVRVERDQAKFHQFFLMVNMEALMKLLLNQLTFGMR